LYKFWSYVKLGREICIRQFSESYQIKFLQS
jgi:hypothetical protein